jgi:Flp pilus assembly protein TadG
MRGEARVGQRGVAAVEFVLVLPLLLMLVMGAIDWGYYFTVREIAIHAAREGARAGSLVGNATSDGVDVANTFLTNAGFCSNGADLVPGIPSTSTAGQLVGVQVSCTGTVLTKFFPGTVVPRTLTVNAQIRHE